MYDIITTKDGGYVAGGWTEDTGMYAPQTCSGAFVEKLDVNGSILWEHSIHRDYCRPIWDEWDEVRGIQETAEGGYLVCGTTLSVETGWFADIFLIKLSVNGDLEWQKFFGGAFDDWATSLGKTSDGGYVISGGTASYGAGSSDALVIKLDASCDIQWQRAYGGLDADWTTNIVQANDGGFAIVGGTYEYGSASYDLLLMKIGSDGFLQWEKSYGRSGDDECWSIQQTDDGGFIAAGSIWTGSLDVDRNGWLLKIDSFGEIAWERIFGVNFWQDELYTVRQTQDGGYIAVGDTSILGEDIWIVKLDGSGEMLWQKAIGKDSSDAAVDIEETNDGGFIIAAMTLGNLAYYPGVFDCLFLKVNNEADLNPPCSWVNNPVIDIIQEQSYAKSINCLENPTYLEQNEGGLKIDGVAWCNFYMCSVPPKVTKEPRRIKPGFNLKITGENFDCAASVYIGDDQQSWFFKEQKGSTKIILEGGSLLKEKFPKGVAVPIKIVNRDDQYVVTSYKR